MKVKEKVDQPFLVLIHGCHGLRGKYYHSVDQYKSHGPLANEDEERDV